MGDHRATVKIEFDFHGKTYQHEWWINWFPDEHSDVDNRIAEWFEQCTKDGMRRYEKHIEAQLKKQQEKETEEAERKELIRLKQKYESTNSPPS